MSRDQFVRQRQAQAEREVSIAQIDQQQATEIAEQTKAISIAQKSQEQSHAQAKANEAKADAVRAAQAVITTEQVASAERAKQVALVLAAQEAE